MVARRKDNQTPRLWVEPGEGKEGPVAWVAPVAPIDKTYSFAIPERLVGRIAPGQRVRVPLGRKGRLFDGFCLEIQTAPWTSTLRFIESVVDSRSFLPPDLLELGRWISHHYACPLGRTLHALVPQVVRSRAGFETIRFAQLADPTPPDEGGRARLGATQKAVLEALALTGGPMDVRELREVTGASTATLRTLVGRGQIVIETVKQPPGAPNCDQPPHEPDFMLNADQQAALARVREVIDAGAFRVLLLFGVSGSGKTEVYIHAMRRVLAAGRQAILLVPEIALTTQLVQRLAARFTDVAVIHSGLTGVARSLTWEAIANGSKRVVIGTRSAVFAPCPNLGLIVVDEEQETSYKNLRAPRFHVRDVAIKRAQAAGIPVLLGSATPSLETWVNTQRAGHYERIDLPRRVRELPLPTVHLVDMRDEQRLIGRNSLFSRLMEERLTATIERGEQALLLLNRRGHANSLFCPNCKIRLECPNCHITLVFHSATGQALCHYCRHRLDVPDLCPNPSCRSPLVAFGAGTQRVEEFLQRHFPRARVRRVDSDTMLSDERYRSLIADVEAHRVDVVVGTQMIAKGLDFPRVSFVGVLTADAGLMSPDFRAAERLFQLITQVAGRAGRRDRPGEVVVQCIAPQTPALQAAMRHDYLAFADSELPPRQTLHWPPFARLVRFVLAGAKETVVRNEIVDLGNRIRDSLAAAGLTSMHLFGPHPCPLIRLRKQYRYELLLRAPDAIAQRTALDHLRANRVLRAKVPSFMIDVDPISMA